MRLLVLDNYDSFTYNLVHLIRDCGVETIDVVRNDKISLDAVAAYDKIVLSPGPGVPRDAGILIPLIEKYAAQKSIFGVCLGMQAMAQAFGGSIYNSKKVFHGVATDVTHHRIDALFTDMPSTFKAGRYHSWMVNSDIPDDLMVTATDSEGGIMALMHRKFSVRGVQFHPESILTPLGKALLQNWITYDL